MHGPLAVPTQLPCSRCLCACQCCATNSLTEHGRDALAPPCCPAVVRSVYSEYGVAGFWRGVGASLVMVCNPTIQYALYEWLMAARARVRQRQLRQQHGKAAAGAGQRG